MKRKLLTISIKLVVFLLSEREGFKMADQSEMEKIITPMMEHLCDHLCRFPWETERKEDLEDICAECQMDQYTNDILNTYNREKQEWIPVTEQLPEPHTDVLVAVYDFGEDTSTFLDCLVESDLSLIHI